MRLSIARLGKKYEPVTKPVVQAANLPIMDSLAGPRTRNSRVGPFDAPIDASSLRHARTANFIDAVRRCLWVC